MFRRRDFEREVADELRSHIEHRADDLVAAGLSREDALRRARVELGGVEAHKEAIRDERTFGRTRRFLEQTARDIRLAARRLAKAPAFALFATASIGLGAGVTTAVFAVTYAVLWAPSGIQDPATVAFVANQLQGSPSWDRAMSAPDFEDFRRTQQSFAWLGSVERFYQSLSAPSGTVLAQGEGVSAGYFEALGVGASLGRVLQPADETPAAPAVAVLSHQFWRAQFAADPGVIGRKIRIGGIPVEIVGVARPEFRGLRLLAFRTTHLWLPAATLARIGTYQSKTIRGDGREQLTLIVLGRLKPGRTAEQAAAEAALIGERLDAEVRLTSMVSTSHGPERRPAARRWIVRRSDRLDDGRALTNTAGVVMMTIIGLVLAVACTNLANLSLARGAGRSQEIAVRLALGASRGRLIRELMAESLLIGAGGLLLAVLISVPLMNLATVEAPIFNGMSSTADPALTPPVLFAAFAAVALAFGVFGLWPAVKLSRADVRTAIAQGGPTGTPAWSTERGLIRAQVIVSVAFFSVASIFISALTAETRHDPGVDLDHLTVARTVFRLQTWDEGRTRRAIDALATGDPSAFGFRAVAAASTVPFGTNLFVHAAAWAGESEPARPELPLMVASTPGIFATLGVPMVHGRAFDERDTAGADPVVVISETTARTLFGTVDAVGRALHMRGSLNALDDKRVETRTVIGVARDTDVGTLTHRGKDGLIYVPLAQRFEPPNFVIARSAGGSAGAASLRALIRDADEDIAIDAAASGAQMLGGGWIAAKIFAGIAMALGALTLILTMAGLFGVLSHLVLRRSREIGIRKALGADAAAIQWMVIRDGSKPVVTGALIGLLLGLIGGYLVRASIPVQATPLQPLTILIVVLAVAPATWAACYLPARRATRVDPNLTLKNL